MVPRRGILACVLATSTALSPGYAADLATATSWRRTSGAKRSVLFSEPSALGGGMRIEVRARDAGRWRTLHLVGAGGFEIMHGMSRFDTNGVLEASAVPSEYLKSMVALALGGLERVGDGDGAELRALFLGLGAGVLPKLLAHHAPRSTLLAVEPDGVCVRAATERLGLDRSRVDVAVADAVAWVGAEAARPAAARREPGGWDAVFVDVFDECNATPPAFRSAAFLAQLGVLLSPRGVVVANVHTGGRARGAELRACEAAYAAAFPGACRLASLDSKPNAGNAILGAAASPGTFGGAPAELAAAASEAGARYGLAFDAALRCGGAVALTG